MKIEKDLKRIKRLTRREEDANWDFRCFLKTSELSENEIDSIVHELNKSIVAEIDCRQCANCCQVVKPVLKARDIERLAKALMISEDYLEEKYLERDETGEGLCFKKLPCPFLKNRQCSIYSHRPDDCRSYPHLEKEGFVFRLTQAFSNCSICPIVYNVYQELKRRLWKSR